MLFYAGTRISGSAANLYFSLANTVLVINHLLSRLWGRQKSEQPGEPNVPLSQGRPLL